MARIILEIENKETGVTIPKDITRDSNGNLILNEEEYFKNARENIFKKNLESNTIIFDSKTKITWESLTSFLTLKIKTI